jgi:RNA polymerase sigma-70 factor (ECF subfamily)
LWEEGLNDEQLVARARENDREAADELVRRYQDRAYSVAFYMSDGDDDEARELVQEAFLKCFRNIGSFRGDSSFYTWFYRILVNTVTDGRRRRQRWRKVFAVLPRRRDEKDEASLAEESPDESPHSDPAATLMGKQLNRDIQKAMSALPEKQRMVFQLRVLHEMRLAEIAEVLNMAEGTVKTHLFRAGKAMREALGDWADR